MKLGLTYHLSFDFQQARQSYDEGFALWQRAGETQQARPLPAPHALRLNWNDPLTLDPNLAADKASIELIFQLFCGLVSLNSELDIIPEVASTWDVLDGGCTYVFHLRDDVCWSDGTSVTAEDFAYAWRRLLHPATGSPYAGLLFDIKGARAYHQGEVSEPDRVGIKCLDKDTLVVDLEGPTSYFPYLLAYSVAYPVPQKVVEAHGKTWTETAHYITNGPFRLESWQRGQSMVLARNPKYHGWFGGNVQRVELSLSPLTDWSARLASYEAEDLDVLDLRGLPMEIVDRARRRHAGEYFSVPRLATDYLAFDVSQPPFDDVRVRRAFVLAADRQTLVDVVWRGYHFPATGGFIPPGMPGHSAGAGLPYNPERARQLLTEAGYPDGRGFPATNLLTHPLAKFMSERLRLRWWENLGIKIVLETVERGVFFDRLSETQPAMFLSGWWADYPDPDDFLRVSHHIRFTRWRNEVYTGLVERARRITDQEERLKLYRQADRILVEEAAIMPLYYWREHMLVKPWVSKFPTSALKLWFLKDVIINPH
jgi:oligopeptide transport system substrate-binding protein